MESETVLEQRAPRKRRQRREVDPAAGAADTASAPETLVDTNTHKNIHDAADHAGLNEDHHPTAPPNDQAAGISTSNETKSSPKDRISAINNKYNEVKAVELPEKKVKAAQKTTTAKQAKQQQQVGGKSELLHFDCYIQIATTDACDATPCVYLRAGNKRFLFNASEGLQRVLCQYKMVSLPKIDAYFMTRVSTNNLAGLPGMLMGSNASTATASALLGNTQCVDVYGPVTLQGYVKAFLPYINSAIGCKPHELDCSSESVTTVLDPIVNSPELTVTPIVLRPSTAPPATPANGDLVPVKPDDNGAPPTNTTAGTPTAAQQQGTSTAAVEMGSSGDPNTTEGAEAGVMSGGGGNGNGASVEAVVAKGAVGAAAEDEVKEQRAVKRRRTDVLQAPSVKPSKSRDVSISYVVKLVDRPGKFNPKKAAQLGVPRGPLYGELQKGKPVMGANQRLVQPHEVVEGGTPGPVIIIVDCPSLAYLPSYAECSLLKDYQVEGNDVSMDATPEPQVVVCHVGPLSVVQHPDYLAWLSSTWAPHCEHLLPSHPTAPNQPTYLHRSSILQAKLHQLDSHVFPLPVVFSEPAGGGGGEAAQEGSTATTKLASVLDPVKSGGQVHRAGIGSKFTLYPPAKAGLDLSGVPTLSEVKQAQQEFLTRYNSPLVNEPLGAQPGADAPDIEQPASAGVEAPQSEQPVAGAKSVEQEAGRVGADAVNGTDPSFIPLDAESAMNMDNQDAAGSDIAPDCLRGISRNVLEVVFLGTASAMPGTYRNVSGTLVNMFEKGCFMVDCGEDSWPQVRRRYGEEAAEQLLRKLQFVWVSHMHADHHGGLYPLLQSRRRALGRSAPPLLIIGPHSLARVLYSYHQLMPMRYAFVPSPMAEKDELTVGELPAQTVDVMRRVKDTLQLMTLRTFKVDHACAAHGLQLEGQAGWKVVFSGDTQPCAAVERAARDATLLVHEATFEDALEHEARMRHHSTVSEALQVARKAGAYRVALTHFSQRYPKLPSHVDAGALKRAFFAFDYTSINLADLERLPTVVSSWDHLCQCLTVDEPLEAAVKD